MLYDYPAYYEVAFSFRDVAREAEFIRACVGRFSTIPVKNVFEIACGPAPHVEALINNGYHYVGMDINRNMLDYATYKWHSLRPTPEFVEADMVQFDLNRKVDFAFVMLGSLYLNGLQEMNSHFDSMSKVLNEGGLYFLDWCIQFSDPLAHQNDNTYAIEKDGIEVESRFNIRLIDSSQQMYEEVWTVNVNDRGRHRCFEMVERNRAIFPEQFLKFIESRTDFEFVGWWKDWDFNQPIENQADIVRPVALVRRINRR